MASGSESFNKANGALGPDQSWTVTLGLVEVLNNIGRTNFSPNVDAFARCNFDVGNPDMYVEGVVGGLTINTLPSAALLVRVAAAANTAYQFDVGWFSGAFALHFQKWVAGVNTVLDSWVTSFANGDLFRFEVSGSGLLTAKKNGTTVRTYNDLSSPITAGTRPGIGGYQGTPTDDVGWDSINFGSLGNIQSMAAKMSTATKAKATLVKIKKFNAKFSTVNFAKQGSTKLFRQGPIIPPAGGMRDFAGRFLLSASAKGTLKTSLKRSMAAKMAISTKAKAALQPPGPPAGAFNVVTYGATLNGTTNDTAAVNSAMAAATASQGVVYFPRGTCSIDGVSVPIGVDVQGSGPASIIKLRATSAGNSAPVLETKGNNTIQFVAIDGNKAAQPAHYYSDAYNDAGSSYKYGATGGGRGFKAGIRGEEISGLLVQWCEIRNTYGAAVATNDSSVITVDNCYVHDTNFELLYFYGSVTNVNGGRAFQNPSGTDVICSNNTMLRIGLFLGTSPDPESDGIVVSRGVRVHLFNNNLSEVDRCFAKCESCTDLEVDHNVGNRTGFDVGYPSVQIAPFLTSLPGVGLNQPSTNIHIHHNTWSGVWWAGAQINSANNVSTGPSLAKNVEVDHELVTGLHFGFLSDGNGLDNLSVHDCDYNSIVSNRIYQNGTGINGFVATTNRHDGIALTNYSDPGPFVQHTIN